MKEKRPNYVAECVTADREGRFFYEEIFDKKDKREPVFVGLRRNDLLYNRNDFPGIFSLDDVCTGRILYVVFWAAGNVDRLEGCNVETDHPMYDICDSGRIYHRDYCEQIYELAGLGLFGSAAEPVWADLRSVCNPVLRFVCGWDISCGLFFALVLWRKVSELSYIVKTP